MTFDLHLENFNSAHKFLTIRHRAFIFDMCVPYDNLSDSTCAINFDHVTLTMTFDLHLENFNSAHNILAIRHWAFILSRCVFYDKTFPMGLLNFDHLTLTVTFDLHLKNL